MEIKEAKERVKALTECMKRDSSNDCSFSIENCLRCKFSYIQGKTAEMIEALETVTEALGDLNESTPNE